MDLEPGNEMEQSNTDEKDGGKADEAAIDLMKQLITLAAGVLALSATFLEKSGRLSPYLLWVLAASWFALTLSVLGGIQTLSGIVKSRLEGDDNWAQGQCKRYAYTAKFGFIIGIACFLIFAFLLLASPKPETETPIAHPHVSIF